MNTLFKDPAWKNIYTRTAIILLSLLLGPMNILHLVVELFFPGLISISSITCLVLLAIALMLMTIAYFKEFRHIKQHEEEC